MDVIPTLLECAGIQVPPHLQGRSLMPILSGRESQSKLEPKPALMEFTGWKMIRSREYRYVVHGDGQEFLYDLNQPFGEYHDVSVEKNYQSALAEMRHHLLERIVRSERPLPKLWTY